MFNNFFSRKNTPRIVLGVLSAVSFYQYFRLLEISVNRHHNNPFVLVAWLLGLISMEMAILYEHPLMVKIRRFLNTPCHIASALYVSASGLLMSLIHLGWDGCVHLGQVELSCMKTMFNVWTYFPLTNPSVEVVLTSIHGFGGKDEVYLAVATFLMALGLVWILNVVTPKDISLRQKVLSSVALIINAEAGFYWLYLVKNSSSWPGAIAFFVLAIVFLMLSLRQQAAEAREMED